MNTEMIILFIIIALVMIGIPFLLGRRTGQNPMEILFGKQVEGTLFARKKKKEDDSPEDGQNADGKTGTGAKNKKGKKDSVQKNSNRQELMQTISDLLSYGRRNHFYTIVPGTLMHGDDVACLAVLMVTKSSVLGFNCFGYGGTIYAGIGEEPWRQVLNGEEIQFESPVARNKKQKEILDAVMSECGLQEIRTEVYGVFTASGVILKDHRNTRCCSQKALMEILKGSRYLEDRGVEPLKVGKELEKHIKKA